MGAVLGAQLCWPAKCTSASEARVQTAGVKGGSCLVPAGSWYCPVCADGRTPSAQQQQQRRQQARSTAKTGAAARGGGIGSGGGARGQPQQPLQGGSRLGRPAQQDRRQPQEHVTPGGMDDSSDGGGDTPSFELL